MKYGSRKFIITLLSLVAIIGGKDLIANNNGRGISIA